MVKKVRTKKTTKKAVKSATSTPEPEKVVESAPVASSTTQETTSQSSSPSSSSSSSYVDSELHEAHVEFLAKLQQFSALLSSLKSDFRALEKKTTREMKSLQKAAAKRKRNKVERKPSGFTKPTLISDELAAFLKVPKGTEMARTAVTKEINKYVCEHNLKDKNNGRKINPDKHLAKLLNLKKGDELTYFNLQKYMKGHFAKASSSSSQ